MTKYTKQLEDEFNKIVEEQFVKTKKELLQALKDATPEDTGEAREGWRLEGNTIVNDVDHRIGKTKSSRSVLAFRINTRVFNKCKISPVNKCICIQ